MTARKKTQPSVQPSGSPSPGEPFFLVVGKLRRAHGIHGEILMELHTDFPERLTPGVVVYAGDGHRSLHFRSVRPHGAGLLVSFEEIQTSEEAGELRNQLVYVSAEDRPALDEGEFYHHELIGMCVFDEACTELGRVVEILETGANDVLVLKNEVDKSVLLPWIDQVILGVDIQAGIINVRTIPGLLPDRE